MAVSVFHRLHVKTVCSVAESKNHEVRLDKKILFIFLNVQKMPFLNTECRGEGKMGRVGTSCSQSQGQ